MLAISIHLDGSHQFGKVAVDQLTSVATQCEAITCEAKIGDILMMKMLVIHRSKPSMSDAPRRAIRIDYSADTLPAPLQWEANAN